MASACQVQLHTSACGCALGRLEGVDGCMCSIAPVCEGNRHMKGVREVGT